MAFSKGTPGTQMPTPQWQGMQRWQGMHGQHPHQWPQGGPGEWQNHGWHYPPTGGPMPPPPDQGNPLPPPMPQMPVGQAPGALAQALMAGMPQQSPPNMQALQDYFQGR